MTIAIIAGSGFGRWEKFQHRQAVETATAYSTAPVRLQKGTLAGREILFLPRHGADHNLPPHRINYRANIEALRVSGAAAVVAIATVGGIAPAASPGSVVIPDQILDYTYGRAHTFFDGEDGRVGHVDMTEPYCEALRACLVEAARHAGVDAVDRGTYAATQGPRFETPAEIDRLEQDGADVVGMTGMPEAALAREARLPYAALAIVVNAAAGRGGTHISMETIEEWMSAGRERVERLLEAALPLIAGREFDVPPPLLI